MDAQYAPPSGPPPPKVPEGWKALWNDQYKEWFYVNIQTRQSQWDKPTEPIYPSDSGAGPSDSGPPAYDPNRAQNTGSEKSNNPFSDNKTGQMSEDEKLARQLQEQENSRGESDSYYSQAPGGAGGAASSSYGQQVGGGAGGYPQQSSQLPPRPEQKKGLFGKIFNKPSSSQQQQAYPQQGYGGYPQQQGMYAQPGYPPQGYAQQPMYAQQPGRKPGMGVGTGAALGVGGGLLGGVLLADALHGGGGGYGGGYGGDDGGGYGGDDGGGDMGGGDMGGGDMGGGDMGGGDF